MSLKWAVWFGSPNSIKNLLRFWIHQWTLIHRNLLQTRFPEYQGEISSCCNDLSFPKLSVAWKERTRTNNDNVVRFCQHLNRLDEMI
ncbi:MAG: hypothetical protein CMO80_22675 [Verrucomicrobiales bacterium]|nr:hypothetical protein [Verrucomicrobiales bacterium]